LGGNRKGTIRTYFNLIFSMLVSGLWHGAAWNFIIWGGYHGVLLASHKFITEQTRSFPRLFPSLNENCKVFLKIIVTQYFIFLGWIMFRVGGNLSNMIYCINKYVLFDFDFSYQSPTLWGIPTIIGIINGIGLYIKVISVIVIVITVVLILHSDAVMKQIIRILTTDWIQFVVSLQLKYWCVYLVIMFSILLCFTPSDSPVFIYYQF
jgi:hypothetical protein